jgi:acyl-CoA thioesterase I
VRIEIQTGCVIFLLSTVLGGCGSSTEKTTAPPPARQATTTPKNSGVSRRTLLFVGTSITAGLGLDPAVAWVSLVQQKIDSAGLPFRVTNAGVSGETSAGALHRIDWLLGQDPLPALVMIETGANDGLRGQLPDSVRANLEAMLQRIEAVRPQPVVVVAGMEALPNLGRAYGAQFRAIFPDVARKYHAVYLRFLLDGVAGVDSLNQADGIHPNVVGSRRVAANVWQVLQPILDSLARH